MGPFTKIDGPESLTFPDGKPVSTPEEYLGWQVAFFAAKRVSARRWTCNDTIYAYVNAGRWVADCLNCGGGMFTRPDWELACCAACGGVFRRVAFPPEWRQIELLLLERPRRENQNWIVGEPVAILAVENRYYMRDIERFSAFAHFIPVEG